MKRKKLLALIVTAGAAALMIAGYLIYTAASGREKEPAKTVLFDAESMSGISYSYKGEDLAFVKKNGAWTYGEGSCLSRRNRRDRGRRPRGIRA
jgi:uncharacterized protein YchJ